MHRRAKVGQSNGATSATHPSESLKESRDWDFCKALLCPAVVPADGSQPDLAAKLENVAALALDEAEAILRLKLPPDDRAYQAVLRAKAAIFNGTLAIKVRVDEVRFKAEQEPDRLGEILEELRATKARIEAKYGK
jgi:hypothetical protein